jgi:ribonuclease P protein subunit RPR2
VFALADALDALTSDRPYRAAVEIAQARAVIESSDGQFDPAVLDAFATISDERIEEIRRQLD